MKVTVEKIPHSSVALDIVADPEEFGKAMDRAFRKVSRSVRIPGFRPGKAPRVIVEQRIGREYIVEEAHREIMDDLYREALEQEDIVPVSQPTVEIYQQEPIGFRVEVQVYPEVDLRDYTSVRVESKEVTVTDEDVQNSLEELQRQHSVWVEPKEPRQPTDGDQVILDLKVTKDEEEFTEPSEDQSFVLGESTLFQEIVDAIKQLHPGESAEFDITFAEDDERANPEIRGATLHYQVTLKEVKERELPNIDDEFAKTVGSETLDELRTNIRTELLRTQASQAQNEVVTEAIHKLVEIADFEIPSAMVDRQVDEEIERLGQRLQQQGTNLEEYVRFTGKSLDELKEEMRPDAEHRVRDTLVLEAFAKAESVQVEEDDLNAEVERLSAHAENPQEMREIYSSPYLQRLIREELANRKLTDRLIEIATEGRGALTGEGATALEAREAPTATSETVEGDEPSTEEGEAAETAAATAEVEPATDVADNADAVADADDGAGDDAGGAGDETVEAAEAKPKKRTRRRTTKKAETSAEDEAD